MATLQDFIATEKFAERLTSSAHLLVESAASKAALNRISFFLAEVRFFAVGWESVRTQEEAGQITPAKANEQRQQYIQRLTTACAPSRL